MALIIHQIICGEHNKAWDLLKTTLKDSIIAKKIAFKTDLQDSPPSGIHWSPVIRGFKFGDFFLLIKTYPDTSPDVRKGRVFSHCLVISISNIQYISNLKQLLSYFKNSIYKSISLETIVFTDEKNSFFNWPENLQLRFNKAIRGYLDIENYNNTIIWIGQEDYEEAVCKFWQLLTLEQRINFNFGINFNTNEIPRGKVNFITTPENIENKFLNSGFCVIRKNDSIVLTEFSEQFLAGNKEVSKRLNLFITTIEARDISYSDIPLIAKGINTFENVDTVQNLKLLLSLSNLISEFSPDKKRGIEFKEKLLDRISSMIRKTEVQEISIIKNFKISCFRDSENKLSEAMTVWIDNVLFSIEENKNRDLTSIIKLYYEANSLNWWVNLLGIKIKGFLTKIDGSKAYIIWQWIIRNVELLKDIQLDIDNSKEAENHFISKCPKKIKMAIVNNLILFSINVKWLKFHAAILKHVYPFDLAITEQLKIDTDTNHPEGIEILIKNISSTTIIKHSITNGDIRLLEISGKLCHKNPSLLEKIRVDNSYWQEIWYYAIKNGNNIEEGLKDPVKSIHKLFDCLVNGKPFISNLLSIISETDHANLLNYRNRHEIWSKLPVHLKNNFLEKTSSALLEALSKDSTFEIPDDETLSDYIISSNAISTFLYYNRSSIKSVLPIFNAFNQLPEYILKDYISNYYGSLDFINATQLGLLVSQRKLSSVAYEINRKTIHNKNFKVALAECHHLLDFITHGISFLAGNIKEISISRDEWWEAFTELSYKLYPSGPTQNKIWIQADGEEYDLLTKASGKETWIDAIKKLRDGSCKDITVDKLLKKMTKEHKKNEELKTLIGLHDKL